MSRGGTFVTTFFSGIVNENDLVTLGGHPGERKVTGIWAEIDALLPGQQNQINMKQDWGRRGSYPCGTLCDIIHAEGGSGGVRIRLL